MDLIYVTFASTGASSALGQIYSAIEFLVKLIQWGALAYSLIGMAIIGFHASQTKTSSEAITLVRERGGAILIGLIVCLSAFLIKDMIKNVTGDISTSIQSGAGNQGSTDWEQIDKKDAKKPN